MTYLESMVQSRLAKDLLQRLFYSKSGKGWNHIDSNTATREINNGLSI